MCPRSPISTALAQVGGPWPCSLPLTSSPETQGVFLSGDPPPAAAAARAAGVPTQPSPEEAICQNDLRLSFRPAVPKCREGIYPSMIYNAPNCTAAHPP